MKKLVLSAVVLTTVVMSVTAQTKKATPVEKPAATSMPMSSPTAKGKWLVGPALSFSSESDDDGMTKDKGYGFNFQPEIGYFIADNLSVGLSSGIRMEESKVDGVTINKASGFSVGPTLRYYFSLSPKFKVLGKFQIPFGSIKQTISNGNPVDSKKSSLGVNLSPAFAFFPSDKICVELIWGGAYFISSKLGDAQSNDFGFDLFNNQEFNAFFSPPALGVKWHLGK